MADELQQTPTIPVPQANVRTGVPYKQGDELELYGQKVRVSGFGKDGSPMIEPATQQKKQPEIKRGQWLQNRMRELYADPLYVNGSPEVKQYYKEKAYNKWVVPYHKHIKMEPMSLNAFVTGVPDHETGLKAFWSYLEKRDEKRSEMGEKILLSATARTSKVLAETSSLLEFVTKPFEYSYSHGSKHEEPKDFTEYVRKHPELLSKDFKDTGTPLTNALQTSNDYYTKQSEQLDSILTDEHKRGLTTGLTDIATQAVFFEALGGAKASKILQVANPRTVALSVRVAKSAWNGAVTGLFWAPTTGGKVQDIPNDVAGFALANAGLTTTGGVFFKVLNKYFGRSFVNSEIVKTASELENGKGIEKPKQESFGKDTPEENMKAARAGLAKVLNEAAQKVGGGTEKGAFKRLSPRQKKGLLARLATIGQQTRDFNLSPEVEETHLKEEEEKVAQVVPIAKQVQAKIDAAIASTGLDPTKAKLGATLPHHETHIDSPIKNITGRIAFLTNMVKSAEKNDLIMSDVDSLREALKQERQLLTESKAKRAVLKKGQTAGATSFDPEGNAQHNAAYEQARREWQESHPGGNYTDWSNLKEIMKRADEIQRGSK